MIRPLTKESIEEFDKERKLLAMTDKEKIELITTQEQKIKELEAKGKNKTIKELNETIEYLQDELQLVHLGYYHDTIKEQSKEIQALKEKLETCTTLPQALGMIACVSPLVILGIVSIVGMLLSW